MILAPTNSHVLPPAPQINKVLNQTAITTHARRRAIVDCIDARIENHLRGKIFSDTQYPIPNGIRIHMIPIDGFA